MKGKRPQILPLDLNWEIPSKVVFFRSKESFGWRFVNWIQKRDRDKQFYFCPLEDDWAREIIGTYSLRTQLIYWKGGEYYVQSDAWLLILKDLGGISSWFFNLVWFPEGIRHFLFNKLVLIAGPMAQGDPKFRKLDKTHFLSERFSQPLAPEKTPLK